MEKLKIALTYGADACYLAGKSFGLRAAAGNFSIDGLKEALSFAHARGKKIYITVNIIPHNEDLIGLPQYLEELEQLQVDGIIVADPGVIRLAQQYCPSIPIHLSTQANNTNWSSALFWEQVGVKRLVMARELSIEDIRMIRDKVKVEIEAFVHGAMCISYSGRCLMSNYMIGRDANRGHCAHPCRWKYYLVEEQRPGQYYPVQEDERGTYIFNSKDMCLIRYIPELIKAGISTFKIEGRMKSVHYVATVIKAYRQAIDTYMENPQGYKFNEEWYSELLKVSHRDYFTGFYFDNPSSKDHNYRDSAYVRNYDFVGLVKDYDSDHRLALVEERNRIQVGDELEVISPSDDEIYMFTVTDMWDAKTGEKIQVAPHPHQMIKVKVSKKLAENSLVRRQVPEGNVSSE